MFSNATDLNNCSTMPLIKTKCWSKYGEAGMMTGTNDEVEMTGGKWVGEMKMGLLVMDVWKK